jgi:DHA1 family inner membrane transport protein
VAVLAMVAAMMLSRVDTSRQAGATLPMPIEALKIPGVKPLLIACGAFMAAFYGIYGYLGDHLHHDLGRPLSANGLAALVYGLGFAAAALLDPLVDRFGARRITPAAFVVVGAVYVAMAIGADSFAAVLIGVFFWGLANHFGLNALIMRLTAIDPARRGTIMGLNSAVTYLAAFLGTTGFGALHANRGFVASALAAAALTLCAAIAGAWGENDAPALALSSQRS